MNQPNMPIEQQLKQTLIDATLAGANVMQYYFKQNYKVTYKEGINNVVTEADHASEKIIFETIRAHYPSHFLLGEESGELKTDSEYKWIIDPIDGTVNFAHHIPICCVSIGLEQNNKLLMGAVFNPFTNEFFFAQKNEGATLNGVPIHVSKNDTILKSCLVTGFPYSYLDQENGPLQIFDKFIRRGIPVRRLGSAALDLCWVAAGRFDGFYEHKLQAWDSAAGFLIVQEAGGTVTDFAGQAYSPYQPHIVASNGLIHTELIQAIHGNSAIK